MPNIVLYLIDLGAATERNSVLGAPIKTTVIAHFINVFSILRFG